MVQPERVRYLNTKPIRDGRYVLYWMQAAQRAEYNHALEFAVERANELKKPVVVLFCLVDSYPEANERHYYFMLEGLADASSALQAKGILMIVRHGLPEKHVAQCAELAAMVVTDAGYLRIQRRWRRDVARRLACSFCQVETNLVVPPSEASIKEEYSAGTFRPRIAARLDQFLIPLRHKKPAVDSLSLRLDSIDITKIDAVISSLDIDRSVTRANGFTGGANQAKRRLRNFIRNKLPSFDKQRNDPCADCVSDMSPYLHFGQISPLYIALQIKGHPGPACDAYIEELIVRRELSHNFVLNNPQYDRYSCLPPWAKRTLNFHKRDKRQYVYSPAQLEAARTHDPYWNAAQQQMALTGKMHGYMRMYWGKKILQWSRNPANAFKTALYLNNKYELDGRDPNAYAGVAWCFGKHDRPWGERPIFGMVRYMNAAALKRKFDPDAYVERIRRIAQEQ